MIVILISLVSGPFHFSTAKKLNLGAGRKGDCASVCLFYVHKYRVNTDWFKFGQSNPRAGSPVELYPGPVERDHLLHI